MKSSKGKKRWIKLRHTIITNIAYVFLYPYSVLRYNIKIERFREKTKRQYLILLNHQTPFDQFFVGISFKRAIYYLATEDIFSNGFVSSLIRYLVAPIPIKKQATDAAAVRNCIRVVKEGGSIAIAPEGNRTYSGKTEYMNPAIASLARMVGLPIVLYRIEGGYGSEPRWSDTVRRGKMHSYVYKIIEPEQYKNLTNEELYELIKDGLYVNEAKTDHLYNHKRKAEYLERMAYICPFCGLAKFESGGNLITCTKCKRQVEYLPTKQLKGVGIDFPFEFVNDWYDYQCDFVNKLDTRKHTEQAIFCDNADVSEVIVSKKKISIENNAEIQLFGDKIVIGNDWIIPFDEVSVLAVLGRNKLNIYHKGRIFQLKGSKRFNALKYVHIYHRNKNIVGGQEDGKFLGL